MNRTRHVVKGLIPLLVSLAVISCSRHHASIVPPETHSAAELPAVREFRTGVERLLTIHNAAERVVPPVSPTSNATEIAARKAAFAKALIKARDGAVEGQVFTHEVRHYFRRVIASELSGSGGKVVRQAIRESNPNSELGTGPVLLQVNAVYPDTQPLSMVPPSLLLRLPRMPEQFDYRFVGRALVLRDTESGVILDILPKAIPRA